MTEIETRCTQCGNENRQDVRINQLQYGSGRNHGTERVYCDTCEWETLQNRCGRSVPTSSH